MQKRLTGITKFSKDNREVQWKTTINDLTHYSLNSLSLSGAAGGGPGLPQVLHQSPLPVSFERSEEDEDHGV